MYKPKVYFISSAYQTCDYVRCYMPQINCGYNGSQNSVYSKLKSNKVVAQEINDSDIVVFHRADSVAHHKAAIEIKKAGKLVVFDNDDTAFLDRGHPFDEDEELDYVAKAPAYRNIIDNFILNADGVTTTTEYLASEYRKLNKNVAVIPNCVDPDDWEEPNENKTDKVRILISGSAAYTLDFEHIKDYLIELDKREDVQLILFGLWGKKKRDENPVVERTYKREFAFWDKMPNLEHHEWVEIQDYPKKLNSIAADIMIIPRFESYFNRCKSNIKFLEASMCGMATVAQHFSTNDSPYEKDADYLVLATDAEDWKKKVDELIADKKKRKELAAKARGYVLANYNIKTNYKNWTSFYEGLYNKFKKQ